MSDTLQPMDCGPPGCSVHGILQEGIPERVAIPSPGLTSIYMDHFYISDTILLSLSAPCNFYFCCGSRFWFSDSNDLSHPTLGPFSHTPWLFFHLKSSCSFSFHSDYLAMHFKWRSGILAGVQNKLKRLLNSETSILLPILINDYFALLFLHL